MDMPDWFNARSFGGKPPFGITPPPMMQQPSVNSQPYAGGIPPELWKQLNERGTMGQPSNGEMSPTPMGSQMLSQSPPSLGPQMGFTQTPMPPQRPSQSVLEQLRGLQAPAGGISGAPMQLQGAMPADEDPRTPSDAFSDAYYASAGGKPAGGREIGPGSWMDKMAVFDKGSLMGSLFGHRNAKPAPGMPQGSESMGMLPLLYRNFLG